MLVKHLRDKNGRLAATVVAMGAGYVGWSVCRKTDTPVRQNGVAIAIGRATKGSIVHLPNRKLYLAVKGQLCKAQLSEVIEHMKERSLKYFKVGVPIE